MTDTALKKQDQPTGLVAEFAALDLPDSAKTRVLALATDYEHAETEIARLRNVKGIQQLGSDELFIQTDNGILRGYKGSYELSWRRKELYTIDGKWNDEKAEFGKWYKDKQGKWQFDKIPIESVTFHLTAAGLGALRVRSGIKVVDETDPEYDRDTETGEIHFVRYKLLFMGYDPTGNLNVQRLLFIHSPKLESLEIIKAAALDEKCGESIKYRGIGAFLDANGNMPDDVEFHPVRQTNGRMYGFGLNLNDKDALRLSLAFINIQKNSMKKGRTVAIRLGTDAWLGRPTFIPYAKYDADGKITDVCAKVTFYGWRQDPTMDDLESLRKHVETGRAVAEWQSPRGKSVQVSQVEIDAEQAAEVIAQEDTVAGEVVVDDEQPPEAAAGTVDPDDVPDDQDDQDQEDEPDIPVTPDPIETPTEQQALPGTPPAEPESDEDAKISAARAKAEAAVLAFDSVFKNEPSAESVLSDNAIVLYDALEMGGTAMLGQIGRHLKKQAAELGKAKEYAKALKKEGV